MPKLVLIRGLPGAGKTTLALSEYVPKGYSHFEADMFLMKNGEYCFDVTKLGAAHRWCQGSTERALREGKDVVVSNTFTTEKEVKEYRAIAAACGVSLEIVNATGNYKSVHNVPEETMQRMRARFQNITK